MREWHRLARPRFAHHLASDSRTKQPGVIAAEIMADLEAALEQFRLIAEDLASPSQTAEQ
jgi:hypothetical protein